MSDRKKSGNGDLMADTKPEIIPIREAGDKVGSVMVIGGGIGGMQASLDLANSGFKVYMVERTPSIGGRMAQLDKSFPTNDCSMCTISPKLIECEKHPNIDLVTYSELKEIEGQAGRFTAKVRKKARSVDEELCTGCGDCVTNCPVQSRPYPMAVPTGEDELDLEGKPIVDEILSHYAPAPHSLTLVLQDINTAKKYLPKGDLKYVAAKLGVPFSVAYHVATFYSSFSLTPRGKHLIQVCMGTACHVRGAKNVLMHFERKLKIDAGETTRDQLFSLETVNCLGACALGPVVVVDGEYHGEMNVKKTDRLMEHCFAEEKASKEEEVETAST
jgi:NADH:ubiquinone oxidoreductase subunit E/NAD-dependent dihydropyrimidine dehydrogenase PreA subunit